MEKQSSIFRKVSLDRLSSPEQLDQKLTVISPVGWIALISLSFLIVASFVWGFYGNVSNKVYGSGMMMYGGGIVTLVSQTGGQITDISVSEGDFVEQGQVIATVSRDDELQSNSPDGNVITAGFSGLVSGLNIHPYDFVQPGSIIGNIVRKDPSGEDFRVVLYVPLDKGKLIREGMEVGIFPTTVNREEHGYIIGRVASASVYAVSQEHMMAVLQNQQLVQQFGGQTAVIEVKVELLRDIKTVSGYQWSTPKGASVVIDAGTVCLGEIRVSSQRPIDLVIPFAKELLRGTTGNAT